MKYFIVFIFITVSQIVYGQLNPIQNLFWNHDYQWPIEPYNTFTLSWDEPENSTDTLIGYNIYGDNILQRFQNYIGAECTTYNTSDCNFFDFLQEEDWIKVTAVYNVASEESPALDSAQFMGLMTGIDDSENNFINININQENKFVYIDTNEKIEKINIFDATGKILLITNEKNIDLSRFSASIYLFVIYFENKLYTKKIILR